ncbi:MAG: hypothetical protein JNM70_01215 [Anaerolineae bacterium]|nr:hypothetical protein [Anaerolineae bacterium]
MERPKPVPAIDRLGAGEPPVSTDPASDFSDPGLSDPQVEAAAARYPTAFGSFSFEELREQTRRYAAYVFSHTYHMSPTTVDEALHVGQTHLWERLRQDSHSLHDKDVPGIGQALVFQALHALRPDWKYQKVVASLSNPPPPATRPHSAETRQIDVRLDLHQAIHAVAEAVLEQPPGKRRDHDLWALYGLTMLHTTAQETSHLFGVREQSMQKAFQRVRTRLQAALPHYAPIGATRPVRSRGRQPLPKEDLRIIRQHNQTVSADLYEAVEREIVRLDADTRLQDSLALQGIRSGCSASSQARQHGIPVSRMRRAYKRVHLLIASARDPTVRPMRPEKRQQYHFVLTPESEQAVHALALELLAQPRSYEKLVALHAHIANLPISRTAQHFNLPIATLRYYVNQIGQRLQTPRQTAGHDRRGFARQAVLFDASAAD